DCTWLLHAHNRLELGIVHGNDKDHAIEFAADLAGNVDRCKPIRMYRYDANARPWFQTALASDGPIWTPIYFWFGEGGPASETGTGYTRIVRDRQGIPLGVLVVDVTLGAFSAHLKELPITRSAQTFLVDEQGLIVAASDGRVNSMDGKRLTPAASDSPAARAIAGVVSRQGADEVVRTRRVNVAGEPARVQATRVTMFPGIRWQVVTVLPEASFLAPATTLQRRAILLAAGAIAAGLALSLFLSRRLSDPLMQLSSHVASISAGDFDSRLQLGQAAELRAASDELNRMAGGLKERMQLEQSLIIAQQVQQSLLPHDVPSPPGLQIAACCKYCDTTGGDYYDFIQIDHPGGSPQTLLVVGDVTGHGIGAALLMASARGAIRASVRTARSLGEILTQANRALAVNENGLFMTMSIMLIDPATRQIRWANAGHDPAIVYHPDTQTFDELLAHDFPLSVEPDVTYREFQRDCATAGTIVMIGTDGIWEARNAAGEMFGKERLRELMRSNSESADSLADAVKRAMYEFVGDLPLTDDVTFVIAKITRS
ncbi:MAG: SpoIIE family protein phosphatase, partial [Anaerolineae bacterium]|nr:SpoIIE family protein phosphatase [Phycisphaerae bacterium]